MPQLEKYNWRRRAKRLAAKSHSLPANKNEPNWKMPQPVSPKKFINKIGGFDPCIVITMYDLYMLRSIIFAFFSSYMHVHWIKIFIETNILLIFLFVVFFYT